MSRAFVKEQDDAPEELLQRPVSSNPNFVTGRGLRLIDEMIGTLRKELARHHGDKALLARTSRDLRYWVQRRTTAQLIAPPGDLKTVAFATRVTIERADGRRQTFAIVGEDEADPVKGSIAYTSPMARALLGRKKGDIAEVPGGEAEIVALEPVNPEG
jgi:transcription elongation GreA/GreB family factor